MKKRLFYSKRDSRNYPVAVFIALLVAALAAIGWGVLARSAPDYALVLATTQDCARAFNDKKCVAIVADAIAIHTNSAPRYAEKRVCELNHGAGGCTSVTLLNTTFFAPEVAVVALARGAGDDTQAIVPLYVEPGDKASLDGRRVYYHGLVVCVLHQKKFGGAGISMLTDLSGHPLTSDAVRKLRHG